MIIIILSLLGLALGSFVNALVWRIHEQEGAAVDKKLSVLHGRSMCPKCKHVLAAQDLVPVLSWLLLRGKCRYCGQPISAQYPLVELSTAALFVASYIWWPLAIHGAQTAIFVLWLLYLTGLMALLVYDARWKILPDKVVFPLFLIGLAIAAISVASAPSPGKALLNEFLAVIVGGGLFYVLFQVSAGRWIGGGDVKLGAVLGLVAGTPPRSLLIIFLASLIGSLVSLPMLASKRLNRGSTVPFGPFLIVAAVIVQLFGHAILMWYQRTFFPFTV